VLRLCLLRLCLLRLCLLRLCLLRLCLLRLCLLRLCLLRLCLLRLCLRVPPPIIVFGSARTVYSISVGLCDGETPPGESILLSPSLGDLVPSNVPRSIVLVFAGDSFLAPRLYSFVPPLIIFKREIICLIIVFNLFQ
jgi:hypothetical protein